MRTFLSSAAGLLLLSAAVAVHAADPDPAERWEEAIARFEVADRQNPPDPGKILFVGSSSIRLWDTERSFPGMPIINRGFGGSQISDVNYFFDRLVVPYRPRVIVFYAGDNDIARDKSPDEVFGDYRQFLARVDEALPETHVLWVPIKPSLKRWEMWAAMQEVNQQVKTLCDDTPRRHYVDIVTPMMGDDGTPRDDLFLDDGLHLNDAGYDVWNAALEPLLEKAWAR